MPTLSQARDFADAWLAAWNAHDLDRVLLHYAEDFEMSSPFIVGIAGEASGVLRGKAVVGEYWRRALARFPDLRLELLGVYTGAGSVVIRYRSVQNLTVCEVFFFDAAGKVARAAAHYDGA